MDIDDSTDNLYTRVVSLLNELNFDFADTLVHQAGEVEVFTLSLHAVDTTDCFPSARVISFLTHVRQSLRLKTNKKLYSLQVQGPIGLDQSCFLNKANHKHYIWEVTLQYSASL